MVLQIQTAATILVEVIVFNQRHATQRFPYWKPPPDDGVDTAAREEL
jgi:hypothetical protein